MRALFIGVLAGAAALVHCGTGNGDADSPGTTPPGSSSGGGADGGGASPSGNPSLPTAPSCSSAAAVDLIAQCIDSGGTPNDCLAKANAPANCDVDQDGLDDSLEDAMLRAYAPAFAFNKGNGDHSGGDSESAFPTSLAWYTEHSTLYWRVDGDDGSKKVVESAPKLESLHAATYDDKGVTKRADSPSLGQGTNFWLCLNKPDGKDYAYDSLTKTMNDSCQLPTGVDLLAVAHPSSKAGTAAGKDFVVLQYMLFYAYNRFTLDDHEGDFEGGAVFVSLSTGKVSALYTDRHPSSDGVQIIDAEAAGAARNPDGESAHYNVCEDAKGNDTGVRFYDFATNRHHPVIYVTGGDHASYSYPGATKIQGAGCFEQTMIRDVHNGGGPKLLPWENAYVADFKADTKREPVVKGVHIKNLGERDHLRESWSAFTGQWGCTLENIPKSYPGPWDNERLCRHWLTNDWGDAPPFKKSSASSCK